MEEDAAPWSAEQLRKKVVVCDNGTGFVKCGFAGDRAPRAVFQSIVGRPVVRLEDEPTQVTVKDLYVGDRCAGNRSFLNCTYPVSNGIITDWDAMEKVWDYAFEERLGVEPSECRILLTDPPLNPVANREHMLEAMFETYGFQGAFVQIQAVLTLYSQGLLTGLVVDSGDGVTHAVPVIDGFAPSLAIKRLNVAGYHVTAHLLELLARRGYALTRSADFDSVRGIKEELCYVADDYQRELQVSRATTHLNRSYTLPDGRVVRLGAERFQAAEVLFQPDLLNVEGGGMADMVFQCIQANDVDSRMRLYEHIVLSGGTTMLPGLPTRMEKELRALYQERVLKGRSEGLRRLKLKVEDPPQRKHMVFVGGAVLADIMKDREDFWITKQEWEEDPRAALRKCGSM